MYSLEADVEEKSEEINTMYKHHITINKEWYLIFLHILRAHSTSIRKKACLLMLFSTGFERTLDEFLLPTVDIARCSQYICPCNCTEWTRLIDPRGCRDSYRDRSVYCHPSNQPSGTRYSDQQIVYPTLQAHCYASFLMISNRQNITQDGKVTQQLFTFSKEDADGFQMKAITMVSGLDLRTWDLMPFSLLG